MKRTLVYTYRYLIIYLLSLPLIFVWNGWKDKNIFYLMRFYVAKVDRNYITDVHSEKCYNERHKFSVQEHFAFQAYLSHQWQWL